MKTKLSVILILFILPIIALAQKDVTTFLGIPVDGYKSEMRKKLISKGFTPKTQAGSEYFEGEFNGADVHVFIGTNNNKVYRIMVCDANTLDEANIKIRFNKLVGQFERNKRYTQLLEDQRISEYEDISYEMTVNNKIYEAVFYQKLDTTKIDYEAIMLQVKQDLLEKYSVDELKKPSEELQSEILSAAMMKTLEFATKKSVWFRIEQHYGKYYIAMFYDNEYNHSDGEDL
jgi:hypothetical protein